MEIMQQGSSHLDGRWRTHMLPYSGHGLGSLPNLHDQLRQQIAQTHQRQDQHPEHIQQQMQQQPQQHRQEQQLHHPSHRQLLHQHHESSRSQPQDLTPSRSAAGTTSGHIPHHLNTLVSPVQSSSLPSHSPTSPTQSTPSPGKSGGKEGEEKKEVGEWEQYNAGAAFLGPTLWDKTLSYDSDLKLEYMDLDEFLNENGIPVDESAVAAKRSTSSSGSGGTTSSSTTSTSTSTNTNNTNTTSGASSLVSISPEAPSSPDTPVTAPQLGNSMGVAPQGPPPSSMNGMGGSGLSVVPPPALSPQEYSPQDYVGDDYCSSPESSDPHSPLQVHEPDGGARASLGRKTVIGVRLGGTNVIRQRLCATPSLAQNTTTPTGEVKPGINLDVDYTISANDLALATVPGQEFDPRTRIFSEEELKPQPMIKKSRKQFVPNELKDDKYWARRRKNNMAAKRSRDARRLKENQIAMRANFLEKENNAMTVELQKAQAIVESLKKRLAMYETV